MTASRTKTSLLVACTSALGLASAANVQAQTVVTGDATLLVNYTTENGAVTTSAAFAPNDSAIDTSAAVSSVTGNAGDLSVVSGINVDATVQSSAGAIFTTSAGNNLGVPLFDSYNSARRTDNLTLTVAGLDEFVTGTDLTLVVYAIGDNNAQDGNVTLTYNGEATGPVFIEADADANGQNLTGFTTFTFTKAEGVDSFTLDNAGNSFGEFRAYNGFSLTGTTVIPEPASLALIGLGSLAMLGRRKKA